MGIRSWAAFVISTLCHIWLSMLGDDGNSVLGGICNFGIGDLWLSMLGNNGNLVMGGIYNFDIRLQLAK